MKQKFCLYRRDNGMFYLQNMDTNKQRSLRTKDENQAKALLAAENEAVRQPGMNLQIAQVYLQHADPTLSTRTWQDVMEKLVTTKTGSTRERWLHAMRDEASLPKGLHREALWIAGGFGPFRPSITVGVKRDAGDANRFQAFDKKLGAVPLVNASQRRKQRTGARQGPQDFGGFIAKRDDDGHAGFPARRRRFSRKTLQTVNRKPNSKADSTSTRTKRANMDSLLITTWRPIIKTLPERERERARELIEKYGENYPTGFIIELLQLFGIHAAFMQAFPAEIAQAGEKAKENLECSLDAVTALQERTRSELGSLVSAITRSGAELNKALETATQSQMEIIENTRDHLQLKIEQEFEKQNLPALSALLTEVEQNSAKTLKAAQRLNEDAEKIERRAEAHFKSAESRCGESLQKLEELNWQAAWRTCLVISVAFILLAAIGLHKFLSYRSEEILANQIAAAAATIDQNREVF